VCQLESRLYIRESEIEDDEEQEGRSEADGGADQEGSFTRDRSGWKETRDDRPAVVATTVVNINATKMTIMPRSSNFSCKKPDTNSIDVFPLQPGQPLRLHATSRG
jgi:hypothetical protein